MNSRSDAINEFIIIKDFLKLKIRNLNDFELKLWPLKMKDFEIKVY